MNDTAKAAQARLGVDADYLLRQLRDLLAIPSPTGYTENIARHVCEVLDALKVPYELTRRGAIRANLAGRQSSPDRAVLSHLDTLGAMVKALKPNGRLGVVPIGTWSARFAEGARVTVFTDRGHHRGTILPLKASGHTYHTEVDTQPVAWSNLELRLDERCANAADLAAAGFDVGDFVAVDAAPEVGPNGFVNARHLDDKAGVACVLAACKAVLESGRALPVDCHLIFTIAEEVGVGASGTLHGDVAEMVSVDNGTVAPGQNTAEYGVTVAAQDSSGPFDYHLVRKLCDMARARGIPHARDVFRYYRSDGATALAAGNDLRTCLVCFAVDASHGYERTHVESLTATTELLAAYILSPPTVPRDRLKLGPLAGFPSQPE